MKVSTNRICRGFLSGLVIISTSRHNINKLIKQKISGYQRKIILQQAEVPGAAWVSLQPAKHLLFCKQFSKMCPSALSILGLPGPSQAQGWVGRGQTCTIKTFLIQTRVCVQNFIKVQGRGLDFHYFPTHFLPTQGRIGVRFLNECVDQFDISYTDDSFSVPIINNTVQLRLTRWITQGNHLCKCHCRLEMGPDPTRPELTFDLQ